jgi:hypothetical protein
MRQVLELVASLVSLNTDEVSSDDLRKVIIERLLSIITHQSVQPLVKPAFKSLECFLGKGTISTGALIHSYEDKISSFRSDYDHGSAKNSSWDAFVSEVFEWLNMSDVAPAAGKFLVTLFVKLRNESGRSHIQTTMHTVLWQRWIRNGLSKNPETLENVKNYLFPPLFKLDRPGSLIFLGDLNSQGPVSGLKIQESHAHSLLQLAAIEIGKKLGLVEEPCTNSLPSYLCVPANVAGTLEIESDSKKATKSVILEEPAIGALLTHALDTVRSLAFSVLVSSSSSIRPFTRVALNILHGQMGVLYADTDAKFRNESLSSTRHMIERLRGATAYLTRECENVRIILTASTSNESATQERDRQSLGEISGLLQMHERFIQWYLEFLSSELIPTASYQRHITALKAIIVLLQSGILEQDPGLPTAKPTRNATAWPFTITFFTTGTMRLLFDLLTDPFEDVRSSAATVLHFASFNDFQVVTHKFSLKARNYGFTEPGVTVEQPTTQYDSRPKPSFASLISAGSTSPKILQSFIDQAKDAAERTGRANYADGVARAYEVLYCLNPSPAARLQVIEDLVDVLEMKIEFAEKDLALAVSEAPIHGSFAALM